jgi:hypothetical protein
MTNDTNDAAKQAAITALADQLADENPDMNPNLAKPHATYMIAKGITSPEAQKAFLDNHRAVQPEHYGRISTGGNYSKPERNPPPPPPSPNIEYGTPAMELYWTGQITLPQVNIGSGATAKFTARDRLEAANSPESAIAAALRAAQKKKNGGGVK